MTKTSINDMRAQLEQEDTDKGLKIRVRCGACRFLTAKCPALQASCTKLGKTGASLGCKHFEADYSHVRNSKPKTIAEIGRMISGFPERMKHLIAHSILNSTFMERITEVALGTAIEMGQPVFINLSAPRVDYLNCWFEATAMGVTKNKRGLAVAAQINEGKDNWTTATVIIDPTSVMDKVQFKAHRKFLTKRGLVNAPNKNLSGLLPFIPDSKLDSYEIPSMAHAPVTPTTKVSRKKLDLDISLATDGNRVVQIGNYDSTKSKKSVVTV